MRQPAVRPMQQTGDIDPDRRKRKSLMRLSLLPCAAVGVTGLAGAAPAAAAGKLSDADAGKIRRIVEAQLAAFADDDADKAFSFATPSIRTRFGDAQRFLGAVREHYAPVYRPASTAFRNPGEIEDKVFQPVELTDADGEAWLALYEMQRQKDGEWRINGCTLLKSKNGARMIKAPAPAPTRRRYVM